VRLPRRAGLAGLLVAAGACTLGPDYERPAVPVPQAWRDIGTAEQESLANTPWWQLFQDPELVKLIDIALAENKDLLIAVERIEEARAFYGISRSQLYPQIDATASATRIAMSDNGSGQVVADQDRHDTVYTAAGTVFWELDFFGRVRRTSEADLALVYATEQARRAVVLSLVADVARVYIELCEADRRLEIARRTLQSRVEGTQLAKDRFDGGVTSELDWRQAEAEEKRTASFVEQFVLEVRQKENELSSLLGRNPGPIARGNILDTSIVPDAVPAGLPSELLERRPDVRQAEEQLAASTARIGAAKALLYPSISLTGSYGVASADLDSVFDQPNRSWNIGANLLQPIFNAGLNTSRVEVAESQQRQALYGYERAVLLAFRDVEDSLTGLKQSVAQHAAEQARVDAENKVLELADLRYRGGVSSYLEVLDAQRSLFSAELDESSALRGQLVSLVQIYKALGGGWPQQPESGPAAADG